MMDAQNKSQNENQPNSQNLSDNLEEKKYPIGNFETPETISDPETDVAIQTLKDFPAKLRELVEDLDDMQLDTQYREKGWTVRQLVNHLADSHINSYIRCKLALTENNPTIKPYDEAKWAELQDSINIPVQPALQLLEGLHQRWVHELKSLTNREMENTYFHPEQNRSISLREQIAFYAWHCEHHLAHIQNLKSQRNW